MKKLYVHSIKIILDNCTGCTHCVNVCPTEAIRIRNSKVTIDNARCIDCGRCIETCMNDALRPVSDDIANLRNFKYKVAILSSAFASQFPESFGYDKVRNTLHAIGFDEVIDEAEIVEIMNHLIRMYIKEHPERRPVISSFCPAVVRLVQVQFPSLLPNILQIESPMSIITEYLRLHLSERTGLANDEIGIFLVASCIAQVISVHQPEGVKYHLQDGAFSTGDIYNLVLTHAKDVDRSKERSLFRGHTWAIAGFDYKELEHNEIKTMAVSGIKNVIKILSRIENQQIEPFDFIMAWSCIRGCVGGIFNVDDPFVAISRIQHQYQQETPDTLPTEDFLQLYKDGVFNIVPLQPRVLTGLDTDIRLAIGKMKRINEIEALLPGLNCGACGSPTCRALAEDIVSGKATVDDCLINLRRKESAKKD